MKKWFSVLLCLLLCMAVCGGAMARTVEFGSQGYTPLLWDVLYANNSYSVLISHECIDCLSFGSSNNWYSSSLRSYLNNSFAYTAFTQSERSAIMPVEGDLVRIPSVGDMTNPQFGFSTNWEAHDGSRPARASATAINNGVWTNDNGYCSYYTMTPCDRTSMYQVRTDGRIGVARIDRTNVGVRIMIKVRTSALD